MKAKTINTLSTCKCGKSFNPKETARVYGKESMVVLLNRCSAQCYTVNQVPKTVVEEDELQGHPYPGHETWND